MSFKFGLEVLLEDKKLINQLKKSRVSLVCHPASVDQGLRHSSELLNNKIDLASAFGPQHGIQGEKQDNMIESEDFTHPILKIPVFSLYGQVRRPTEQMMQTFDVMIFDLQDLGCRIYTFVTTLLYVMEECARFNKKLIVLDRPNPAGREVEGFTLETGWESFVGAAPFPMRHGLTVAELALYFKDFYSLELDLQIVKMKNYNIHLSKNFGWPKSLCWVNPSPNAANVNMARFYSGSVLVEGTTLSEGRGTTRALELIGASDLDFSKILTLMRKKAPQWMKGAHIRECFFEPTFHKHEKKMCHGFQVHTDDLFYKPEQFKPFRLVSLMLKCINELYPRYPLFRDFPYEYTYDKLAFDVINGGPKLRQWIENSRSTIKDLDNQLKLDEKKWIKDRKKYLLYSE